jgi:hypothetical protein
MYVGRIYEEAKGRPLYLLKSAEGFQKDALPPIWEKKDVPSREILRDGRNTAVSDE